LVGEGIVIDGLPIMLEGYGQPLPDLGIYYESCVIGGTGAFVLKMFERAEFGQAIRHKLVLEITGAKVTGVRDWILPVGRQDYNCLIVEELHESGGG